MVVFVIFSRLCVISIVFYENRTCISGGGCGCFLIFNRLSGDGNYLFLLYEVDNTAFSLNK